MRLLYPAFFHKEDDGIWIEFPDLEGCFSDADTELEAMENAESALALYLDSLDERGIPFPSPSSIFSFPKDKQPAVLVSYELRESHAALA